MALVLDLSSFVESTPEAGPFLDVSKLGLVADVAGTPAGPVDVAALGALPILCAEQSFALLGCVLADLDAKLPLALFDAPFATWGLGLLHLAPVAPLTPGKIDVPA